MQAAAHAHPDLQRDGLREEGELELVGPPEHPAERLPVHVLHREEVGVADGTEVEVGRGDPQLRLSRFARMLPRLERQDPRQLQRADLRYTNGFALTWRAAPAASPPASATQAKS